MLPGGRSFVDRAESVDFQKTGTFHVLVVAGLHVGALVVFLYWFSRRLRLGRSAEAFLIIVVLFCYVMVVEQRTPVLRAGLTTAIVLLGSAFYRRLHLLNSAALAALLLLLADPAYLTDSGFLLSFLAIGCIAGIAMPLLLLGSIFGTAARIVALPLAWLVLLQHRIVSLFAGIPHMSYRIPGPPAWLTALFFLGLIPHGTCPSYRK
jgi:ComEC/Rec2-related protein